MKHGEIFIGVDVGTSGVRAIAADASGDILSEKSASMRADVGCSEGLWREQESRIWLSTLQEVLRGVFEELAKKDIPTSSVKVLSVDSTSGTLIPVDKNGSALSNAIMYNDGRASDEARFLNELAGEHCAKMGYKFAASFALSKILWIKKHRPEVYDKTYKFLNAADYLAGNLSGHFDMTDTSNALKMGYDLIDMEWPSFIKEAGIDTEKLPLVLKSGDLFGEVTADASSAYGVPEGVQIIAGLSDGTAGFFASGAKEVGDFNTTIGSTLVIKGISEKIIVDPLGRIYSHYHPDGWWLPGGASNCGGKILSEKFQAAELDEAQEAAEKILPTDIMCYPLAGKGERLPFVSSEAEGFCEPMTKSKTHLMAAISEGLAFVERWVYEMMEELSARIGDTVYSTGGCVRNNTLNLIRASVLKKKIAIPENTESALGSAVIAASRTHFGSAAEAAASMVRIKEIVEPQKELADSYDEKYAHWRALCARKGLG